MTFRHRAGVSPYTSSFDFAETCVLVNSRLGRFTAAPSSSTREGFHSTGAPLLPKLRGHFAEFLFEGSSDRLGILYLPTCVGFGTGTPHLPRRFSRRHGSTNFSPLKDWSPVSGLMAGGFPYRPPYAVSPGRPSPGMAFLPVRHW